MKYFIIGLILIIVAYVFFRRNQKKEMNELPDDPNYVEPEVIEEDEEKEIVQEKPVEEPKVEVQKPKRTYKKKNAKK